MKKNQTSRRGGFQDFLCPFENFWITQVENVGTHRGTKAVDIASGTAGKREAYYAPCDVVCKWVYPQSGQSMWQSVEKVRCANGYIGYVTFMIVHDDTFNAYIGMKVKQGEQLGNMGSKGNATGVHCHIEVSQSNDTIWKKNQYGIYNFNTEAYIDDTFFMDGTNILKGLNGKWKFLKDVPVQESIGRTLYLPATADTWKVYPLDKAPVVGNEKGFLRPSRFGGLTYPIISMPQSNVAIIDTRDFGRVQIYVDPSTGAIIK